MSRPISSILGSLNLLSTRVAIAATVAAVPNPHDQRIPVQNRSWVSAKMKMITAPERGLPLPDTFLGRKT